MNSQRFLLAVAAWVMGVAATAAAATTTVTDDFNDGVRNKDSWRVQGGNQAYLREQFGKLWYSASATKFSAVKWGWRTPYVLIDHDILDCIVTMRMPVKLSGTDQFTYFGVGLEDAYNPGRHIHFFMRQTASSRWFAVEKSSSTTTLYGPKIYPATIQMRIRYSNRVKTVSFAWRKPGEAAWHEAASAIDLNAEWGAASQRTLQPYIYGVSAGAIIPGNWFQLDDFTVVNKTIDAP